VPADAVELCFVEAGLVEPGLAAGFVVTGFACASPFEAWPALATGMKAQLTSSAQSAPSRAFRIPADGTVIKVKSLPHRSAGILPAVTRACPELAEGASCPRMRGRDAPATAAGTAALLAQKQNAQRTLAF